MYKGEFLINKFNQCRKDREYIIKRELGKYSGSTPITINRNDFHLWKF